MNAPRRWIDEGGSATPFERDLLRSARSVEPPPGAQSQVLAALLASLPPPGGPGGSGPAGAGGKGAVAKAAATSGAAMGAAAGILKGAVLGAGSAIALIAAYTAVTPMTSGTSGRRSEPPMNPPAAMAPLRIAPAPIAPVAPVAPVGAAPGGDDAQNRPTAPPVAVGVPVGGPTVEHRAAPAVTTGATGADTAIERETMLREENRQMSDARAAMRRGDAPGALALLEQVRAHFPGGVLVQEREALAIEALARSGRRSEASARAAAFLRAYPTSMLAERVQAFTR